MLILQVVPLEPLHGYAIAQRLQHISRATGQGPIRGRSIRRSIGSN